MLQITTIIVGGKFCDKNECFIQNDAFVSDNTFIETDAPEAE